MNRLYKHIAKVTLWRETVPTSATTFTTKQLVPGQQLDITDIRIRFRIRRALTKTPNQLDLYLYNLSDGSRADLETRPLNVNLAAGYDDVARLLFTGDLRFGMSEKKGATWESLLQCGDGDREYAHARVNRSYRGGTTIRTVLKNAAASMGLQLPKNLESDSALNAQFLTGVASHGPARDELTRLLAPLGYHWSIQCGVLQVLRDDEATSVATIPIDEAHGMIDTPTYGSPPKSGKPPHVNVKCLLYPEVVPGAVVQVTSKGKSGRYRVEKVDHEGDTHAPSIWTTSAELQPF